MSAKFGTDSSTSGAKLIGCGSTGQKLARSGEIWTDVGKPNVGPDAACISRTSPSPVPEPRPSNATKKPKRIATRPTLGRASGRRNSAERPARAPDVHRRLTRVVVVGGCRTADPKSGAGVVRLEFDESWCFLSGSIPKPIWGSRTDLAEPGQKHTRPYRPPRMPCESGTGASSRRNHASGDTLGEELAAPPPSSPALLLVCNDAANDPIRPECRPKSALKRRTILHVRSSENPTDQISGRPWTYLRIDSLEEATPKTQPTSSGQILRRHLVLKSFRSLGYFGPTSAEIEQI